MYGVDADIGGGTPGGAGGSGGGAVPSSGSSSAQSNDTWGKAIQVVYGCAVVKGVPLMLYVVAGQETGDVTLGDDATATMDVAIVQFGLAIGEVASVDGIVYYDHLYGPSTIAGHQHDWDYLSAGPGSFPPTFPLGDVATAAEWTPLAAMADDYRIPFGHLATLRCERMGLPDGATKPPELKAVVSGFFADRNNAAREAYLGDHWTINDANPADVIRDLIENTRYGLGFPAGTVIVDVGSDGLAASSYETYCDAFGLWIAIGVDETVQVADVIAQILQATNAVGFWEGNSFKVVPLGDLAKTANGVTYTPISTALAITDDVLILEGENPVQVRRRPLIDTFNSVPVRWSRDTAIRDVELVTTEVPDTANVDVFGMRRADPVELPCIRTQQHAAFISKILTDRSLYARDVWEFRVNPRAAAVLQVGDMVALTHSKMGADGEILRIIETDEDERGELAVKAVKWLSTTEITVVGLPGDAIIPASDTMIVHVGTYLSEPIFYVGPTWDEGAGGGPASSAPATINGKSVSGMAGWSSRQHLTLPAGNVASDALAEDFWVITVVLKVPTISSDLMSAAWALSIGTQGIPTKTGLGIYAAGIGSTALYLKTMQTDGVIATPAVVGSRLVHVVSIAKNSANSVLVKVDSEAVAGVNFSGANWDVPGDPATYLGTYWYYPENSPETDTVDNSFGATGAIYEVRMVTRATAPDATYLAALHTSILGS